MASNRFRYPPAPGNGMGTFSDNLVGNQYTDGSSLMTNGTFTVAQDYSRPISTDYNLGVFTSPITLESLNIDNEATAKSFVKNSLEIFVNNDTNELSSFVLYGSLTKRLSVAVENIVNFFPGAIFADGIDENYMSGNTTAYNIGYNSVNDETTFRVNINRVSNPFNIEFTTNGSLAQLGLTPQQLLNNLEMFGNSADTVVRISDGSISKLRNLTTEFKDYVVTFSGALGEKNYKIINLVPQTINTTFIELTVEGNPFSWFSNTATTTTTSTYYITPNTVKSEEFFNDLKDIEAFLLNRECHPIYTATFKLVRETNEGASFYVKTDKTWPLEDRINIDITTSAYTDYIVSLADLGDEIDGEKTNLISRFLTSPILKEFDNTNQKIEKTLQIYGRSFDDIKTFVDGIAYMTNVTYDGKNDIPNQLIKNFARTLGWSTPSTLDNKNFLDSVLGVTKPLFSGSSVSKTPAELDVELYRRILMNTSYLFKSKGTRKSIEFLLSLLGAPQALIEFNEYVVLADAKINLCDLHSIDNEILNPTSSGTTQTPRIVDNSNPRLNCNSRFYDEWKVISGGSYTNKTLKYSPLFNTFYTATGTTEHPFTLSDYPIDKDGFPKKPRITNNYFFQRGAGWFERTEEHKSNVIINTDFITGQNSASTSVLTGCSPYIATKFSEFTYGGFWTMGKYSNDVSTPYLDRFWRFPHMSFGFGLTRTIDDKKSWSLLKPGLQTRDFSFNNRDAYYQTRNEKLVINVKNVDLALNIGQGLTYDVWQQAVQHNCIFSGGSLPSPYPSDGGRWDSTNPKINAKKYDFKSFLNHYWKFFIDAKNRMTINDGKTGGYPTLQQLYLDYLYTNCGDNNKYTYTKMLEYAESMGDYWIRIIEQMVPATTLWTSGLKVENSVFHRDKFVYRCYDMTGVTIASALTSNFTVSPTGYTGYQAPLFVGSSMGFPPPQIPTSGSKRYNNILGRLTPNPISTYANSYNINNHGDLFGSTLVSEKTNLLANQFKSNKSLYTAESLYTKQGSTDNLLCVNGLKEFGSQGIDWINQYTLDSSPNTSNTITGPYTKVSGTSTRIAPTINRGNKY